MQKQINCEHKEAFCEKTHASFPIHFKFPFYIGKSSFLKM